MQYTENEFKKGDYVVLLSTCDGKILWSNIPINHCYKLTQDSTTYNFMIELDMIGSKTNGWSILYDEIFNKLKLRKATQQEEEMYIQLGKPYDVSIIKEEITNSYLIY